MNIPLRFDIASGFETGHYKDKDKFVKKPGESIQDWHTRIFQYIVEQTDQRIDEWESEDEHDTN